MPADEHLQWGATISNNELGVFVSPSSLVAVAGLPTPVAPFFGFSRIERAGGEINQPLKHDITTSEFINDESRSGISPTVFGRQRII